MALDTQGILAAVTIAIYVPFLLLSCKLVAKYGTNRGHGWILLLVFCIIRVLGGSLLVAAEDIEPVNTGLYIGGYALEASGLSPLLLCTLGLLHTVFQTPQHGESRYQLLFRFLHLLGIGAVILTIIGISNSGSSSADTMRRAGILLFVLLYAIIVGICLFIWSRVHAILKYRKELLKAISIALPFLVVRTVYSVLSTFSSSSFSVTATTPNDSSLARFNIVTGEWQIYLVMDMLMEYAVVIIYTVAGLMLPLDRDYKFPDYNHEQYPLSGSS